jgi:SNF2 family DNA or RNA helicase
MLKKSELHKYQEESVNLILDKKKVALFMDVGIGKTIISLTAIEELFDFGLIKSCLIVTTLRNANSTWHTECQNWEHTEHMKVNICTGKNRQHAVRTQHHILVTNYDNLIWFNKNNRNKYDMIIIDESTAVKNRSTKRFKIIKPMCINAKYVVNLTATPAPNGLTDLWAQIYLLDCGKRLERTYGAFINKYFYRPDYSGFELIPREKSFKKITQLISGISKSLSAEDYLELPNKIVINNYCELDPKLMKQYKYLKNEFIYEFKSGKQIGVDSASALSNKLFQFTNGFLYEVLDNKNKIAYHVHDEKIKALKEIIEQNPGENILVSYNFQEDIRMIQNNIEGVVLLDNNHQTIKDWNAGKIKVLLAHNRTSGLNLQHGGSIVVWYSLTWDLEAYIQFNGRLYRQGQIKPVRIIHIAVKNTIDDRIANVLIDKNATQRTLLESVRLEFK